MRLLRIVQLSNNRWRIENSFGDVVSDDLTIESQYRAEEYIKNYISSYLCYDYEVVPLTKENNNGNK